MARMPIYSVLNDYWDDITPGNRQQRHARGAVELTTLSCRRKRTMSAVAAQEGYMFENEKIYDICLHLLSRRSSATMETMRVHRAPDEESLLRMVDLLYVLNNVFHRADRWEIDQQVHAL
eukprot:7649327-Heterocapsa_arctica.AAC.1